MIDNSIFSETFVRRAAAFLVFYVTIGTFFYHAVEKWSYLDSVYFTVVTLATIGYGDFAPHTAAGKLFTIFYAFLGVGLFVAVANFILREKATKRVTARKEKLANKEQAESTLQ